MNSLSRLAAAVLIGTGAVALSACATGLPTKVSRFQAMPAPAGQSFFVVAADKDDAGSLQFSRYAAMVADAMRAQGYSQAPSADAATMLVKVDYGVDDGEQVVVEDAFARSRLGFGDHGYYGYGYPGYGGYGRYDPFLGSWYGRPYYSRLGYYGAPYSPFYYGWDDPMGFGPYGGYGAERSYTVYKSFLELDIRRRADNAALFEGNAQARSRSDELNRLVPNLIEAMFTGFPGRNGETVKITVPPRKKS